MKADCKEVKLTNYGSWVLYRGMVCDILEQFQVVGEYSGVDSWEFSSALDMSFNECYKLPVEDWPKMIRKDIKEYLESVKSTHH